MLFIDAAELVCIKYRLVHDNSDCPIVQHAQHLSDFDRRPDRP